LDHGPVEQDHRRIWQTFADHFFLFRGTPSGAWLAAELVELFGVTEKLSAENAQDIYDHIAQQLATPAFQPRALYDRFNIEVLATTDAATDTLEHHLAIRASGWHGDIRPTFRPDGVVNLDASGWRANVDQLGQVSGLDVYTYAGFVQALEQRRQAFQELGATATDHAVLTAYTGNLSPAEAEAVFARALRGQATSREAQQFTGHMLMEMARMSVEDGLVMQLHVGSVRNHNLPIFQRFGPDRGADIPQATEFVHGLQPLLNRFGNDPRMTLILFTLDESTYARELAPLAGHYPAVRLGPPWWFHDSLNGIRRYFDRVMETAGLYNTVGFNDDTRAFPSIPARHDLWRRASADWLAGLVVRGIVDDQEAGDMAAELAYGLARRAYRLSG
jgi:glucuronate isomerase